MDPEHYAVMRNAIDSQPEFLREGLERQFENEFLLKSVYPHLTPKSAHNMANAYALTVTDGMKNPKRVSEYLYNSAKSGLTEIEAGTLWTNILNQGGKPTEEQEKRLAEIEKERLKMADNVTSNSLARAAGQTLSSLVMTKDGTLFATGAGVLSGLVTSATAGSAFAGVGAVAGAALYGAGLLGQAYLNGKLYAGWAYEKMIKAGIDHDTAKSYAYMDATGMALIELMLGAAPIGGLASKLMSNALVKNIAKGATGVVSKAAIYRGMAAKGAAGVLTKALDTGMEGVEETAQAYWENLNLELAALEQERQFSNVDWQAVNAQKESYGEAFKGGLVMAGLLGVPGAAKGIFKAGFNVQKAKEAAGDIETILKTVPDYENRKKILAEQHGAILTKDAIEELSARDALEKPGFDPDAPAPFAGNPARFRLNSNGKLAGNPGRDKFTFSDYETKINYGAANYEVIDDENGGGQILIKNIDVKDFITNKEELKGKVLQDIAAAYPEHDLNWDTGNEQEQSILKTALKQIGLERDSALHQNLFKTLLEFFGQGDLRVTREMPPLSVKEQGQVSANKDDINAFYAPGIPIRPERVIYLAEKGKFVDLVHELYHAKMDTLSDEAKAEWSAALKIENTKEAWNAPGFTSRDGKTKINAHEYLAEWWEDYRADPTSPDIPPTVKTLFDKVAEEIRKIFKALGRTMRELPAELRPLFEKLDAEAAAAQAAREAESGTQAADAKQAADSQAAKQAESGEQAAKQAERQEPVTAEAKTAAAFNAWAANPTDSLPAGFHYVKGDLRIRREQPIEFTDEPAMWITTDAKDLLFPNPRLMDQLTNISELYEMDQTRLLPKGKNSVTVTKAVEMKGNGHIDYPGKLEVNGERADSGLQFALNGEKDAAEKLKTGTVAPQQVIDKWKAGIDKALDDNTIPESFMIDIGEMPYIYSLLGITEKQLKARKKALLKAMGKAKRQRSKHFVKRQTLDNLIEKIYNPEAVFKSHSKSDDPNSYTIITDEVDNKGDIVVVILKPYRHGTMNSYALIPTIYGKRNFDDFVQRTAEEGGILYAKSKSSRVVGKLQSLTNATQELNKKLIVKEDIVNSQSPDSSGLQFSLIGEKGAADAGKPDPQADPLGYLRGEADKIPGAEDKARVLAELAELEKLYPPDDNKYLSPNGEQSKLKHAQWYAVRTPSFKKYFGDWERLAKIDAIHNMEAMNVPTVSITLEETENAYESIGIRTNKNSGLKVKFVHTSLGKILRHKGFDHRIIPILGDSFESAVHGWDENVDESHKKHPNFTGYSNFLSKVKIEGKDYFIRYTLQNLNTKKAVEAKSEFHSAFVSDVEIYSAVDSEVNSKIINMARSETNSATDKKLKEFFASVNPSEVSAARDLETGEPAVQTNSEGERVFVNTITEQAKDAFNNAGTYSEDDSSGLLFSLTRDEGLNAASEAIAEGVKREDFIENQLKDSDALPHDIEDETEARDWFGQFYDDAKAAKEGKAVERLTTTEIDERLTEDLRKNNGKFQTFMEKCGALLRNKPDNEADARLRSAIEGIARPSGKKNGSGGYRLFENAARRAYDTKEPVEDSAKKSLISYMSHFMTGTDDYPGFRYLYTRLTGDAEYTKLAETEIYEDYASEVQDRGRLTPYELGRQIEKIRDRALREKIKTGAATDADYRRVIDEADRNARELETEIAGLEKTIEEQAEALNAAAESKREALKKLKKKLAAKYAEREAARRLLEDKRYIMERALKPPANNVDAKTAQKIKALQAAVAAVYKKGRTPATVTVDGERLGIEDFRAKVRSGGIKYEELSSRLKTNFDKKGANEWTLQEVKEFKDSIDQMKALGRAQVKEKARRARILARGRIRQTMDEIERAMADPKARGAAKRLKKYFSNTDPKIQDKLLEEAGRFGKLRDWIFIDNRLYHAKLLHLRDLIAEGRDEANYQEGQNLNRRYAGLDALLGETEKERSDRIINLGTENIRIEGIYHNNKDWSFSKSFLMTASIGLDDPKMRKYILYGVLTSPTELRKMADAAEAAAAEAKKTGDKAKVEAVKAAIKEVGDRKEAVLREAIKEHLTPEDLKIRDYIKDDFTENFDRIMEAVYQVDGRLMKQVESYLPIFRTDKKDADGVSINGAAFNYSKPENGWSIERVNIPEYATVPVEMDIFKLFYRGVEGQEHFAAFAPFIKELNAVLGTRDARGMELKDALRVMHGQDLTEMIKDYIAVMANPRMAETGSDGLLGLAGKANLGYISGNLLSGLKQYPQSFTPFLLKVKPGYLGSSAFKYIKSIGLFNNKDYNALKRDVFSKSSDAGRRVRNIEQDYVNGLKERAKNPLAKGVAAFTDKVGMAFQRWADEFATVSGWDAAYNQRMDELAAANEAAARTLEEAGGAESGTPQPESGMMFSKEEELNTAIEKLDTLAVPMLKAEYSVENYNKYFKGGYVKTPIKTVKMGTDQYAKLGRKDGGSRQSYIAAAWQTLTDPVVIIREGDDDVYIKSFSSDNGITTFVSVEKNKGNKRLIVTNYIRHKAEVIKKIKRADGVIYLKDNVGGSPARTGKGGGPHADGSHTLSSSANSGKKSSGSLLTAEEMDKEARKYADSVLAQTQPTTNVLYQSKGFREAPKILKFFSTPLEKMFQMALGMPEMVKEGQAAYIARYIAGTVIVSLAIALAQRKFDDDDEPEEKIRKIVYYGLAEPTAAHLPLAMLSGGASWAFGRMLGEKRPAPTRDFTPLLSVGEDMLNDMTKKKVKMEEVIDDAGQIAGYLLGLPSVQARRIRQAIEDGDPYGAIVGRK